MAGYHVFAFDAQRFDNIEHKSASKSQGLIDARPDRWIVLEACGQ